MKEFIKSTLRRAGFDLVRYKPFPEDLTDEERDICRFVAGFTKTGPERQATLVRSVQYVIDAGVPGDIVETGVWRGGSMMAVARALMNIGDTSRTLYLYDTFEGMSPPTERDVEFTGESAEAILQRTPEKTGTWCYADLEDVTRNMTSTGYPLDRTRFVVGKVEESIPADAPEVISILRLDTDWYESTKHALVHLYPRLSEGGLLIMDDYGHWQGCKQAADEYFAEIGLKPFLHRVDYTCRMFVKA